MASDRRLHDKVSIAVTTVGRRRLTRSGIAHVAAAAVLLLAAIPLALSSSPAQPPAVAEFAPQAQQQIKQAPNQQVPAAQANAASSTATPTPAPPTPGTTASGPGGGHAGQPTPPATPLPGRVRQCYGNPPRQTPDPQSPPCVPYWPGGDNGGATSMGVTVSTINVTVYDSDTRVIGDLQSYFNARFELYGRSLTFNTNGPSPGSTCDARRNGDAATVGATAGGQFASTDSNGDWETCYAEGLAARHVVYVANAPLMTESYMASRDPYLWQYSMDQDQLEANWGRWACNELAGRPPAHAKPPTKTTTPRVFGAIVQQGGALSPVSPAALQQELSRCGASLAPVETTNESSNAADYLTAVQKLKTANVTTVFCFCLVFTAQYLPQDAQSQDYYPEWLVSSYGGMDSNVFLQDFWPTAKGTGSGQATSEDQIFGITVDPPQVPYNSTAVVEAVHEVDPTYTIPTSLYLTSADNILYHTLLLLASGIQMAGPHLTPQTFRDALLTTEFPNPPSVEGRVGFRGSYHSMTFDGAEIWWNPNAPSPYPDEGVGTYCYVARGARRTFDTWPTTNDSVFFTGSCPAG